MSKSNPYGIYENIPFVQSEKKQFSSNFNTNGIVSPTTSAGTSDLRGNICRIGSPNPTSHVPSLAGNKISDSWFSNSFVNAGGFAIKSVSEPKNDIDICQSNSRAGSVGRSGDFVNSQFSPSGRMHQAVKYRGAKTSPMSKTTDEWDFLSTLNDILRKENFLSDSDQSENKIYGGRVSNYGTSGVPENREYTPSKDISSRSMSTEPSTSLVQIPMSPRPPRPARRSDGRRKDFMKARSMNLDGVLPVNNLPSDILAPPIHFTDDDTFGAKRYDSFGKQQVHHGIPLSSHPNLPSSMPTAGSKERSPSPTHVPTMPVTKSCLSNTMSSSLDSIYDRLKSVEEYEKNYVNNTNFLPPLPFQSSKREAIGGRHLPDYPRPYNQPPISNGFNASYDNGLNSSSSTDWSHYKHLQQDFNGEMKNLDKNSMPDVSVPNYWMMPQFKSRSYGSLKGSLLGLDYEDRLLRLESDKDTLHLQVSVLSDQIEAQTSKIQDLEKLLDDKKNILETTEEQLQRELVTRSGLETQKLELMTEISGLRLKQATLERENIELKGRLCTGTGRSLTDLNYPAENRIWDKPPAAPGTRGTSPAQTASELGQRLRLTNDCSQGLQHHQQRVQTPPANAYRRVDQTCSFGTLPRRNQPAALSTFNSAGGGVNLPVDNSTKCNSLSSGNINAISVNFSQNGAGGDEWQRRGNASLNATNSSKSTSGGGHKSRRILRILGKLKRSNSGGLDNEVVPETHGDQPASHNTFVRGGLRATAAPRLGWVKEPTPVKMPEGPITSWDSEAVVAWLNFLGLGMYANEVKRWVKSGQQLLDATTQELEKELSIKNGLHRKKLGLALHYLKHPDDDDNAGKLDYHWVTRWLDDVGLPQYKEAFAEGRVDGRILSHLTAEDLFSLKVTSMMHHSCIKRGIQILRIHRFHPSCLCRRGSTAGLGGENLTKDPKHVATWTNHRVMEWLKAVDLAEYAPNLRGSGVHGALIVFEPRFNSELLATLLSIPGNKTLLRRHLSLQFNELIGRHIVQEKRLAELAPDFIPINPTVKVKPAKKAQFALRKKRLSNEFSEELLCPLDWNSYPTKWDSQSQLNSDSFESEGSLAGGKVSNI